MRERISAPRLGRLNVVEDLGLQASELARLVIAVLVLPAIVFFGRRLRVPAGGGFYMYSVIAVYLSYVLTLLEEFWFMEFFDAMQHGLLAVAGVLAFVAALRTRREAPGGHA
jgi:hypothetical protein